MLSTYIGVLVLAHCADCSCSLAWILGSRKDEKESDEEEKNEKRKDDSEERKPERQEEPTP